MRRWIGYGLLVVAVIGCRKAIVRGGEDGCEDGKIEGITFAQRDREACLPPDPYRESYGFRGCGFACKKQSYRDGHQDGWEECFVEGYESTYSQAIYEASCPDDTGDTAPEGPDACEMLQIGPDRALDADVITEEQLTCDVIGQGLVDSDAAYQALFDCVDTDAAPPDPDVDFSTEDLFVEFDTAFTLGVALGVYGSEDAAYLLHENVCPPQNPPPPFRSLRLTVVPKGVAVLEAVSCIREDCP